MTNRELLYYTLTLLIPLTLEYLVIINAYNADILSAIDVPDELEYALLIDIIPLVGAILSWWMLKKADAFQIIGPLIALVAHLQWMLHSPFREWPISGKSVNDVRHRTEYYDTHVMCFAIYAILLLRRYTF